jgi:recombinational DNA repair protein (RecF pathway)
VTRLFAVQLRLAHLLGVQPELHWCVGCRGSIPPAARFAARRGGLLCDACGAPEAESFGVGAAALAYLRLLGTGELRALRAVPPSLEEEIETVIDVFLRCHLPHYSGLRGRQMLRSAAALPRA